jgi:hypothetical protein
LSYIYRVENENEKEIIKWLNGELSSKEIEDLKQSEGFGTLEKIAHYASHLETPKMRKRHWRLSKLNLFRKKKQSTNAKLQNLL